MSLMSMLEAAQGGGLFASVGKATGLDEGQARAAMTNLCPAIAEQMRNKAESDEDLYDSLLDLLEDNENDSGLDDAEAMTDAEAVSDGQAILEDIYGSRDAAVSALQKLVPDVDPRALPKLGAISATSVLSAIAEGRKTAQGLSGTQGAAGGGLLSIILQSILKGFLQSAKRSIAPRRRRRRSYGRYYSRRRTRRTTTRRRTRRTPLEEIFGEILGTRRR